MAVVYCNADDVIELFIGTVLADAEITSTQIDPCIEWAQDKIKRLLTGFSPTVKAAWDSRANTPQGTRRVTARLAAAEVVRRVKGDSDWADEWEELAYNTVARLNYGSEELYETDETTLITPSKSSVKVARDADDREVTVETLEDL